MLNLEKSDSALALDIIRRLIGSEADPDRIIFFIHEGEPKAKGRARFTKTGHAYTPKETSQYQTVLAWKFKEALAGHKFEESVAISAIFFRPNYQRIDADNMMKLVMDAGTQADIWVDDCYVTAQSSYVELDRERPRTLIVVAPTISSLNRALRFICKRCNKAFNRSGVAAFKNPPDYCSRECRYAESRAEVRCPKCDTVFSRKVAKQTYCSRKCSDASPKVRQKQNMQRPKAKCQKCGGSVSRREYLNCANCRGKGRKIGSKNKVSILVTEDISNKNIKFNDI